MAKITIDGKEIEVENGIPLIQACEIAGIEIPRFCYHDRLKIAGNCRMCLVEVEKAPKPVASCAMPVSEGMIVHTNSPKVKKAREGVMEFLLINHPLDCPICDKGGECDLQDQAFKYGQGTNRFEENKRAVKDKNMGPLIQTHMTRCIHCTRCVRFITDIAGIEELGALGRGEDMEITSYLEKSLTSEISGNIIDVCPVGALNSKPYAYTARNWELKSTESIDVFDAMGCNIRIDSRGLEVMRILPRVNEEINEEWISDKTRFSYDGLKRQRLDAPYIKSDGKLSKTTWDQAITHIISKIKDTNPEKISAIAGSMADCESMLALKMLLKKLGSTNIDFNEHDYKFDNSSRGNYLFNSGFNALEEADLIFVIGADIRKNAPILNARITKLSKFNDLNIFTLGASDNQTYRTQDLGDKIESILSIQEGAHEFCAKLSMAKKPLMIIGDGIYSRPDSINLMNSLSSIAKKYNFITDSWNGFNILHNDAATTGALSIGFIPESDKFSAKNMAEKVTNGELEILFLLGADEVMIPKDHKGLVIYIGHHGDRSANIADIILPSCAFTEKNATYVNNEGRIQKTNAAILPPFKAMADFEIILKIAESLNIDLGIHNYKDISDALSKILPPFSPHSSKVEFKNDSAKIKPGNFSPKEINFYITNSISRNSPTMAACVKEFDNPKDNLYE